MAGEGSEVSMYAQMGGFRGHAGMCACVGKTA